MGQMGFFEVANRYASLDAKADPLAKLDGVVAWEAFRPRLEEIWRRSPVERKSKAGRKPWGVVVIFKAIVLCELYNLSDEQLEYQVCDRLSFMRFLGLGLEDRVPDATTLWLYREQLAQVGAVEELSLAFDGHLKAQGWLAMGGQMIDASIVPVPRQRNGRDENLFGAQSNDMGGTLVRSIAILRAKARIGLKNLAYNMRRVGQLEHLAAARTPT